MKLRTTRPGRDPEDAARVRPAHGRAGGAEPARDGAHHSRRGRRFRRRDPNGRAEEEPEWGAASFRSPWSCPVSSLTFLDDGGRKRAVVEIGLAAVEDSGARSTPVVERQEIVVTPEALAAAAKEPFVYRGEFKSRTGNMRFVATVRDVATNRVGVGSTSVRIE